MYPKIEANLGNLILSLSDALDLAYPSLAMHQQRTAFIAWELGKLARLEDKRVENVFISGLLHDIGALSIEEKRSLHDIETTALELHCIRGWQLFKSNPWLAPCADLVRNHHRDWVDWEEPRDNPKAFDSQLLYLADYLERQIDRNTYILHQNGDLCNLVKEQAGKQINRAIVDLFLELSQREEFWLDLTSPRLYSLLLHHGPFQTIVIDLENIVIFAKLLSVIVDFKSPFTAAHSSGVAESVRHMARKVGMSESEVKLMEVAGLLHDLGKLVIPNSILEKPGKLTSLEFAVMKQHTYYTFSILSTIEGLRCIAEWAAYHHERLDGKGYPFRREGQEINLGARIMAVSDIFTALSEDRPYRKKMEPQNIKAILQEQASQGLQDRHIVNLLLENFEEIRSGVLEKQEQVRLYYRTEFLESE
jgi:HD-GYP domain-containing protein (c-di-GMP phosphodiesterase class II)